jgi:archaellum component FlaC
MVGIAVTGVVVAAVGTAVAWQLVGEVDHTLDETLAITNESLTTIEDTIGLADVVVADVATGLVDLDSALTELEQGLGAAQPLLGDVGRLTSDVPEALVQFQSTLDGVTGAAAEVDRVLAQLSSIPFAPDVDPQQSLSAQLGALSSDLDPVIETLRSSSTDLERLSTTTAAVQDDIAALGADLDAVTTSLQDSSRLVGQYREQAERAGALTTASREDLDGRATLMRTLIVVGGLLFAVSQFVPLWVGLELLGETTNAGDDAGGPGGGDPGEGDQPVTSSGAPGATGTTKR